MKTIAVGMREGELLPPYHRDFDINRVEEFNNYLDGKNGDLFKYKSNVGTLDILHKLIESEKEIEIIGAYGFSCVAGVINYALRFGFKVFSPEKFIFDDKLRDSVFKNISLRDRIAYFDNNLIFDGKNLTMVAEFDYELKDGVHIFTLKEAM